MVSFYFYRKIEKDHQKSEKTYNIKDKECGFKKRKNKNIKERDIWATEGNLK